MAEQGYTVEQDLKEAQAMVDGLDRYVTEEQLYGTVGGGGIFGGGKMPSLTIGALLMRIRRLHVMSDRLNDTQKQQLETIATLNAKVHKEWKMHYESKMVREAKSRLDAMSTFFEECTNDLKLCARVYLPEVQRRTVVEEIRMALEDYGIEDAELDKKVKAVDARLRRFTQPSSFVWSSPLKPAYSQNQFWWMYSAPPLEEK
jgi:hypothetical protein